MDPTVKSGKTKKLPHKRVSDKQVHKRGIISRKCGGKGGERWWQY
jgi:hypothetical protein